MKKRILPILLPLVLILCMGSSSAVLARATFVRNYISFNGKTAECSVSISAAGQKIDATLELWEKDTLLDSWTGSGYDVLRIEGNHRAVSGHTYTVKVNGTIDGIDIKADPVSKTCP